MQGSRSFWYRFNWYHIVVCSGAERAFSAVLTFKTSLKWSKLHLGNEGRINDLKKILFFVNFAHLKEEMEGCAAFCKERICYAPLIWKIISDFFEIACHS